MLLLLVYLFDLELGPSFDFASLCISDFPSAASGFSGLFIFYFLLSGNSVVLILLKYHRLELKEFREDL